MSTSLGKTDATAAVGHHLPARWRIVPYVLAYTRELGGDVDGIIQRLGLPTNVESLPEAVLSLPKLRDVWDLAARSIGDPFFGVSLAERHKSGTFGLAEFACRSAATVREGLGRITQYYPVISELIVMTFTESDEGGTFDERIPGTPSCLCRHAHEYFAVSVAQQTRAFSRASIVPDRVYFAHTRPSFDIARLEKALGTRNLEFGRESNGLTYSPASLDTKLAFADAALLSVLDAAAQKTLREVDRSPAFVALVRRTIRENLDSARPPIEVVSKAMGTSPRSLQRRLSEHGVTFAEVLDGVRRELCLHHIEAGSRSLGEIATMLGYSDARVLLRAFKRWTGATPSQYRASRT